MMGVKLNGEFKLSDAIKIFIWVASLVFVLATIRADIQVLKHDVNEIKRTQNQCADAISAFARHVDVDEWMYKNHEARIQKLEKRYEQD